ncbi:hypothetical protein [Persicirhabdus sediminis]|uniref:hypothetical protein n=1 Tax=Persicirhabdus sediminis TaxID=454144 RepID=UPI001F48BEC8|nr:hypothetical protein [Persicirhabdus sediminis]
MAYHSAREGGENPPWEQILFEHLFFQKSFSKMHSMRMVEPVTQINRFSDF